jgi:hypothetical protein
VQVVPTELILKPGDKVNFRVRLFRRAGNFIREEPAATWSLDQLKGTIENGQFTAGNDALLRQVGQSNRRRRHRNCKRARFSAAAVE